MGISIYLYTHQYERCRRVRRSEELHTALDAKAPVHKSRLPCIHTMSDHLCRYAAGVLHVLTEIARVGCIACRWRQRENGVQDVRYEPEGEHTRSSVVHSLHAHV